MRALLRRMHLHRVEHDGGHHDHTFQNKLQLYHCADRYLFLANGLGSVLGSLLSGRFLNESFRREASLWNYTQEKHPTSPIPQPLPLSFPVERTRLSDAPLHSVVMIIGFLIFGWSVTPPSTIVGNHSATAAHWITPLLAQFVIGYSNTSVLNSNNALVVDLFPGKGASASAVINLSRNLTAAVGVALVDFIEDGLSAGWLGVVLASLVLVGVIPLSMHAVWGKQWREQREVRNRGNAASEV